MDQQGREGVPRRDDDVTRDAQRARHLAAAQEITHIGSWEWDLATGVVTWSDELYRIYGLPPRSREITLDVFLSFVDPADRDRIRGEVERALARGGRFTYHERIVRPDGSRRDLDTVGEVLAGPDGRPVALIGTCRDITDSRKRDEALRLYADTMQSMQIGVSVWRVDEHGAPRLAAYNKAAERLTGIAFAPLVGRGPDDPSFPIVVMSGLVDVAASVVREQVVRDVRAHEVTGPDGARRFFDVRVFPLPARSVGLAFDDVTDDVRARALRGAEQRILEKIAAGAGLRDVLDALVIAIEDHAPGTVASVLLLDADGKHLRHGAAPHLPAEYTRAIDGSEIGARAGSCGTAAYLGRAVFVADVQSDPLWADHRAIAARHGLRACWSTPIVGGSGRIAGTFAMYYREPRMPTDDDVALIERATHLAGVAIQRHELDERLRALSAHVEAVQEEERTEVAREIHDELGQALTALKIDVAWVARRLATDVSSAPMRDRLASMSTMIDGIIDAVRRISAGLRPGVLDELGLVAAIEWKAQDFEQRTGIPCAFRTDFPESKLPRPYTTALFRTFQEALTNVARHAEASHVDVSLTRSGDRLRLEVCDDGKGISDEAATGPASLGLLGARERARRLGGLVLVRGAPGAGTTFTVDVPWPAEVPS